MKIFFKLIVLLVGGFLGLIILYFGFLWFAHDFDMDFLKIDQCLDAGNSWDYQSRLCQK